MHTCARRARDVCKCKCKCRCMCADASLSLRTRLCAILVGIVPLSRNPNGERAPVALPAVAGHVPSFVRTSVHALVLASSPCMCKLNAPVVMPCYTRTRHLPPGERRNHLETNKTRGQCSVDTAVVCEAVSCLLYHSMHEFSTRVTQNGKERIRPAPPRNQHKGESPTQAEDICKE